MRVLLSWLREFVDVPVEPRKLAVDLTQAGLAVDAVEPRGDDVLLDIDVTTNRVDCMNVFGVAREVSVLYDRPLRPPDLSFHEAGPPAAEALEVTIDAPDLCPRFCARVLDVRLGPSPAWLRDRLEAVGVRPIHNVVDLTNYVMMELGHPSHAFDLAKVPAGRLVVRWAKGGEPLTTLDGVARTLTGRSGVVAGPDRALAVAGVMGGHDSEVSEATRAIALEAAYWEPLAIRRAARELGMHTEASHRFERGADPEGPLAATARIAHLLEKIGAGTTRPGLIDRYPAPRPRRTAVLRQRRIAVVLGGEVPEVEADRILRGLGFGVGRPQGEGKSVEVPSWRGDVSSEVDLIEEVGRHHGLDKLPFTIPPATHVGGLKPWQVRERAIREYLEGAGLSEVINYSFVPDGMAGPAPPRPRLANPLSEDQGVLRSSLVVPGLLTNLKTNLRHGRRDVRLFEVGRVFRPAPGGADEERRLGVLLTGPSRPGHWSEKPRATDVFDMKGLLEGLAERLGLVGLGIQPGAAGVPTYLHPGKSAVLSRGGAAIGHLGTVHPDLAAGWELRDETVVAELSLEAILDAPEAAVRSRSIERFPAVTRDVSVVGGTSITAAQLQAWVREAAGPSLRSVSVADRYEGPPVPAGQVSLTLTLRYQDPSRTLAGDEVQASVERVVQELRRRGLDIRGE